MYIDKRKIKEMYDKEDGKLILDFEKSRYQEYLKIINNTKEYKEIAENIPDSYSNLEKAYYVYTRLGKLLFENNTLMYNHMSNIWMYYDVIRDGGIGNCRQMSELFVSILTSKNIIDRFYLTRKPVKVEDIELRHIDAVLVIDGKNYLTDLIRDTINLRAGLKVVKFGFEDSKSKRIEELKKKILKNNILSNLELDELIKKIENSSYEEILKDIEKYQQENKDEKNSSFLKDKIKKIKYIEDINKQIGALEVIPKKASNNMVSIESLDEKVENVHKFKNLDFPFNIKTSKYKYLEEIIQEELIPNLIDKSSKLRIGWSYSHNGLKYENTNNGNLEMDIDIIIDFFSKVSPSLDPELFLKYMMFILSQTYKQRDTNNEIDYEKWVIDNIKLHKIISEEDLKNIKQDIPLDTILVIRKFNPKYEKEKYFFYEVSREPLTIHKNSYSEMIETMKSKKVKICSKFSQKRKEISDELEI